MDKVENILLRRFRGAMVPSGNAPNIGGTEYYSLSLILRKDTNFYAVCQPFQRQFLYKFTNDQPARHITQKRPLKPALTYRHLTPERAYNDTPYVIPFDRVCREEQEAGPDTPRGAKVVAEWKL
jgi:hypothetical protein